MGEIANQNVCAEKISALRTLEMREGCSELGKKNVKKFAWKFFVTLLCLGGIKHSSAYQISENKRRHITNFFVVLV